ncbi:MAG: nucleotidyltransferase domain-containing protein [Heyndrickxia sp.]
MANEDLDVQLKSQLKVLREISTIFKEIDAEFYLRGGWAIDFLLGEITRPHSDIDIVTWIIDREQLENALLTLGYEQIPVKEEFRNRQSDFRKDTVDVTFGYLTYNVDGSLIMNGLPEWVWRKDSLLPQEYPLHGVTAKVIHPKQLLEEKEIYEQIGRPYRQKDADSKEILRRIISDIK